MKTALLHASDLSHRYASSGADIPVLKDINLTLQSGDLLVVRGASGSGKTTLLSILGGMLRPSGGQLEIDGNDPYLLSPSLRASWRAHTVGFVFQTMHLLPFLNVLQNVQLPLAALSSRADSSGKLRQLNGPDKANELLEQLGLGHRLLHKPAKLSVGERQRVALARAFILQPILLLADEPTGNLDPDNSQRVLTGLEQFREAGGTVVLATHAELPELQASRVLTLK